MYPKDFLAVSVRETSIVIEGKNEIMLNLLGSTFTASAPSGHMADLNSIMIETGPEDGIIALKMYSRKYSLDCFLEIKHEGMNPKIDRSRVWFPDHTLAQIGGMNIYVTHGGVRYSTFEGDRNKPGYRYVPDRDLLCKFIYKQISEEDLKKAAQEAAEEISAQEALTNALQDNAENAKKVEKLQKDVYELLDYMTRVGGQLYRSGWKKEKLRKITEIYLSFQEKYRESLKIIYGL